MNFLMFISNQLNLHGLFSLTLFEKWDFRVNFTFFEIRTEKILQNYLRGPDDHLI